MISRRANYFSFTILILFLVIMGGLGYFLFFDTDDGSNSIEDFLRSIGFESSDVDPETPAVPLPQQRSGSSGSSGTGGRGATSGSFQPNEATNPNPSLAFCTFDATHALTGQVPCRCGLVAVCDSLTQKCDATFNNGQGVCS